MQSHSFLNNKEKQKQKRGFFWFFLISFFFFDLSFKHLNSTRKRIIGAKVQSHSFPGRVQHFIFFFLSFCFFGRRFAFKKDSCPFDFFEVEINFI